MVLLVICMVKTLFTMVLMAGFDKIRLLQDVYLTTSNMAVVLEETGTTYPLQVRSTLPIFFAFCIVCFVLIFLVLHFVLNAS